MQSATTDKLLKPPRGGGKSKEKSGFRSAERCLRSLSRQIPAIQMKFPEEVMVFIGKSDRLLAKSVTHKVTKCRRRGGVVGEGAFGATGRWTNRRESINYEAHHTSRLVSPIAMFPPPPARSLA